MKLILLAGLFVSSLASGSVCKYSLDWDVKSSGTLINKISGSADFIFLNERQILVVNFPEKGKELAPIHIYTEQNGKWTFDKIASKNLPQTYHARQIILEDIDGDKSKEIIIADHGTDHPPYPGSHPFILRQSKGKWTFDSKSKQLGSDFTFNVAAITLKDGSKALFKANVDGKKPFFFVNFKNNWRDISSQLPRDLSPHNLCMMTVLAEDFDLDGSQDLYLGGCDRDKLMQKQKHDRILSFENNKWVLQPEVTIPARPVNSMWGTVYLQKFNSNDDAKTDLLVATHDYGFHKWKVLVYENQSQPGKFKFSEIPLPLAQEEMTEGYVNSLEDVEIKGLGKGILVQVMSLIRDSKKKRPESFTRLILKDQKNYIDASTCLPEVFKKDYYHMKKFPNDPSRVLMVPYQGEILSLKVTKKN